MSADNRSASVNVADIMHQAHVVAVARTSIHLDTDSFEKYEEYEQAQQELRRRVERLAFERDSYRQDIQRLADRNWPTASIKIGFKESQYPCHLRAQPRSTEAAQ